MTKIIFLPFLDSLGSGHHHVALAVAKYINIRSNEADCQIIDILYRWNPTLERAVTKSYLQWVKRFPKIYAHAYRRFVFDNKEDRSFLLYNILFIKKMKKILKEENPDLIVCTHAIPSHIVNKLKESKECTVPLINIYTDFFINDLWGMSNVDLHFVSDNNMKLSLIKDKGIDSKKVFVTGIPIDEDYHTRKNVHKDNEELNIIISGGSAGLGNIEEIIQTSKRYEGIKMYILCGHNKKLYKGLKRLEDYKIQPLPYISSKKKMNELYNSADAIISKPGGVTISEAIHKEIPIFINSVLPGQEEINLQLLIKKGLVFPIDEKENPLSQVKEMLKDNEKMLDYKRAVLEYKGELEANSPSQVYNLIEKLL